jgi:ABC-type transport system substrate-binding protein
MRSTIMDRVGVNSVDKGRVGRRGFLKTVGGTAAGLAAPAVIRSARAAPPFFKLYMMIPNNQPARMIWGTLAAQQMSKLGIDVISSYVDFPTIASRRTKGSGKTHPEGGWDSYLERYYYNSITPLPNSLFRSSLVPPNGPNFYYVSDPILDKTLDDYAGAIDPAARLTAIKAFEKRWYDTEPMTILFYPEDAIAVNPKLTGFNGTTFNPIFFPQPENWTIAGAGDNAIAAFASWPPPSSLIPMYIIGYHESNIFGPVYSQLLEYDSWENKKLVPGLAESVTSSTDGKHHVIKLRSGVTWHSGEKFTAADVKFTWDVIMNKAYASALQGNAMATFGSTDAYKVTGPLEITVDLPQYSILFREQILSSVAIMPEHAYKDIKPEALRGHVASTWLGSYTVKTSDGKEYTAHGGIGTGPWIPAGYDASRKAYKFARNEHYWKPMPGNVKTFYVVNINGTDAVLSALKSGDIDAHDPMYDIGSLLTTVDPSWGKVARFDSYKWQHVCYNLRHPVFGTGVETPLGKQDPSRAFDAAAYIRKAISYAMPREQIVQEIAAGLGHPGTVAMPWSAPEYDHDLLKPIPFDMDQARAWMTKAGYVY